MAPESPQYHQFNNIRANILRMWATDWRRARHDGANGASALVRQRWLLVSLASENVTPLPLYER